MAVYLSGGTAYPISFNADRLAGRKGWSDVVAITSGEAFNAHRLVLSTASALLAAKLKTAAPLPKQQRVLLELHDDVAADTFEYVLEFLYTGRVELRDEVLLPSMLDAALRLQLPQLQTAAVEALEEHLTASACLAAWEVAERGRIQRLELSCRDLAVDELARLRGAERV
jgi:hypothetical protein